MNSLQPYKFGAAITKSDSVNLAPVGANRIGLCDAIYVGGAGVVPVVFPDGSVVNFTAVAGEILPVQAMRVNDTNCTASLMVALYYL